MSKRFTIDGYSDVNKIDDNKNEDFFIIANGLDTWKLCDLLNALHEENQYLQTRIQMLEGVMNTQHYYQKIADNRTEEVFQIRQTITEAYNNERTMIGKSVLKQLMETIQ